MRFSAVPLFLALLLTGCAPKDNGTVQGYAEGEYVRVAAPFAGSLTRLAAQRGAQVKAGAPLYSLEQASEQAARQEAEERLKSAEARLANLRKGKRPDEVATVEAQLAQAQAVLKLSQAQLKRDEELVGRGFISRERLDQSRSSRDRDQARVDELAAQLRVARLGARSDEIRAAEADMGAARAAVTQAQWRLDQKSIKAPVSGLVQDTYYVAGEWVNAGSPVVSILPPENIKLRFFVPEPLLGKLRIGQSIQVSCDGCGAALPASISYIAPGAEYTPPVIYSQDSRAKLVFLIEARLAPADAVKLHPGQPVDVRLK
jgi:HlyD family secretion protein